MLKHTESQNFISFAELPPRLFFFWFCLGHTNGVLAAKCWDLFPTKINQREKQSRGVPLITPLVFKQVHRLRDYSHIYSTAEEMLGVLAESLIALFIINILT